MSAITTHVLDTVLGKPGAGIRVGLEQQIGENWVRVGEGVTDADGRSRDLGTNPGRGTYRLTFGTGEYFNRQARSTIYPQVIVEFQVKDDAHYHLPLLLSDNCYTTYRGS